MEIASTTEYRNTGGVSTTKHRNTQGGEHSETVRIMFPRIKNRCLPMGVDIEVYMIVEL